MTTTTMTMMTTTTTMKMKTKTRKIMQLRKNLLDPAMIYQTRILQIYSTLKMLSFVNMIRSQEQEINGNFT